MFQNAFGIFSRLKSKTESKSMRLSIYLSIARRCRHFCAIRNKVAHCTQSLFETVLPHEMLRFDFRSAIRSLPLSRI